MLTMATFLLKRGDTETMTVTLHNADDTPHNLSGADDVTLHIWVRESDGGFGSTKLERAMTIDPDPTLGKVTYLFVTADWDTLTVGDHRMEYEVTAAGSRLTFPNGGPGTDDEYDTLEVTQDIGDKA